MSGGNCHVSAKRVAPGSSEAIAHQFDICLLRRLIYSSNDMPCCGLCRAGWLSRVPKEIYLVYGDRPSLKEH